MKFNINRDDLLKPLQLVVGVVDRKGKMPILNNILVKVTADHVTLVGTDLEVEQATHFPLDTIETPGVSAVPARKLLDICRALPEGSDISVSADNNRCTVKSGNSVFDLACLPADDFPNFNSSDKTLTLTLSQQQLRDVLDHVHFAMAHQDVRYYFNGVLLDVRPHELYAVATDGHRMATKKLALDINVEIPTQVIVPRKTVQELLRILEPNEQLLTVELGGNHIGIKTAEWQLTSKLIDGKFPDYERLLASRGDKKVTLNKDVLKQALSRAAILANEKQRHIRLQLRENAMGISSTNLEQEAAEEALATEYKGENLDIGFNVSYLLDALNAFEEGGVVLTFGTPESSAFIENVDGKGGVNIVMPARL